PRPRGSQDRRRVELALRAPGGHGARARRVDAGPLGPLRRRGRGGRGDRSAAGGARAPRRADAGGVARAAFASVKARSGLAAGPVLIDVQATQSKHHRDRGVARYTAELASAVWDGHPGIVHSFLLNPDAPPPGSIEALVASGRLSYSDRVDVSDARMLHVCSPFELDVPITRLWPARAATRGLRLAVTLYDLIPEIFADRYLADPGLRRRYRARLELVRAPDLVLAISARTAAEAAGRLHVREERIVSVGAAAARSYDRPASRTDALHAARAAVPDLEDRFVLYTAGMDDRKNFQGLFRAWSRLALSIREQ